MDPEVVREALTALQFRSMLEELAPGAAEPEPVQVDERLLYALVLTEEEFEGMRETTMTNDQSANDQSMTKSQ